MINVVLPTLSDAFSVPMSVVQWVPVVNLTVVSATMLLFGKIGDAVGYRKPFLWGYGCSALHLSWQVLLHPSLY